MVGRLRVRQITNDTDNGAPDLPYGIKDSTLPVAAPSRMGGVVAFQAGRTFASGMSFALNTNIGNYTSAYVDTTAGFNITTGVYTVSAPGIYYISGTMSLYLSSIQTIDLQIRINGNAIDYASQPIYFVANQWGIGSTSMITSFLPAGTTISMGSYCGTAGPLTANARYQINGYRI